MSKRPTCCTWDGERWTNPSGEPCNEDHCAMRGKCPNHVRHGAGLFTCGACVGRVRTDLYGVALLCQLLRFDALNDGIESEAMNLIAAAADPQQYGERRARLSALYERQGWCEWPRSEAYREDDPRHPYSVLGRLDMALRETYGPQTDLFVTVSSAIDFLIGLLKRPEFVNGDEFEDTAKEIRDLRRYLEGIDNDSREPEMGRPCPTCAAEHGKGPRLRKRYAKHPGYRPGQRCEKKGCKTCAGDLDAWHCPDDPVHAWTEDEYRNRVDADYRDHAHELAAPDLAERLDVPLSTVRKWCARTWNESTREYDPPLLVSRRRGPDGRKVYRVSDALRLAEKRTA